MCEFCGYVLDDRRRAAMEEAARRRAASASAAAPATAMPAPAGFQPAYRSLDLGVVLGDTFSLFFGNLVPFAAIVLLVLSPAIALFAFAIVGMTRARAFDPFMFLWLLAPYALALVLLPVATAALTFLTIQQKRGKRPTIGEALTVGLSRLPTLIGVGFVSSVALLGGFFLCFIPGLFVMTILSVATPVAVAERSGVFDSLGRSVSLTEGYRWPVFGALVVVAVTSWVAQQAPNLISSALPHGPVVVWILLAMTLGTLVLGFGLRATAQALLYYHLRVAKESIDANELAAVFD